MPRQFFIGDIHGHYDGLRALWDLIDPDPTDQIYCVGDLIDRGPCSAAVVEFVRHHAAGCVLGNHEQLLMDAFGEREGRTLPLSSLEGWLYSGGQATLNSYQTDPALLEEHLIWLRQLPSYIDLGHLWLVHAGSIQPFPGPAKQLRDVLDPRNLPQQPHPLFPDKLIITGHTITFTFPSIQPGQVVAGNGWLDIDTGVYHPRSGWLTALDWDNQRVYQVNVFSAEQRVRSCQEAITYLDPTLVRRRPSSFANRLSRSRR